ncbi:MAG: Cu(I)-responsive transcriptional regulator [Rhodospirillales bacterium]
MNIGNAAARSGVPAKTIRYYESIGLIRRAARTPGNYRDYDDVDLQTLRFIQRARKLGFSVKDVGALLALWRDKRRASGTVKRLAEGHIAEIDRRVEELKSMRRTLTHLMERCHGDERPDCPIIDELAGSAGAAEPDRGRKLLKSPVSCH